MGNKPRKFRHTSQLGNVVEVEWTPDGLEVSLNGRVTEEQEYDPLIAVEYGGPAAAKAKP